MNRSVKARKVRNGGFADIGQSSGNLEAKEPRLGKNRVFTDCRATAALRLTDLRGRSKQR